MKTELLMNPSQHFHDNRCNNFNAFISHLLSTKNKYKASVLDMSILIGYISTVFTMITMINPKMHAVLKLAH